MSETVNDILGKGFKYEQRIEIENIVEKLNGTIAAFVGGANWGPVGEPTLIEKSFSTKFGTPIDYYDYSDSSGLSCEYHLNYSPIAWFIRVTNGKDTKATKVITKQAEAAKVAGNIIVANRSFMINATDRNENQLQNNLLAININGTVIPVTLSQTPSVPSQLGNSLADVVYGTTSSWNYNIGEIIDFEIDGNHFTHVVAAGIIGTTEYFTNIADKAVGTLSTQDTRLYEERWIDACKEFIFTPAGLSTITQASIISATLNKVMLTSIEAGVDSKIKIFSIPRIFNATPANPIIVTGVNTPIASIVTAINSRLGTVATSYISGITGFLEIITNETGDSKSILIANTTPATASAYSLLGLSTMATANTGKNAVNNAGTFLAKYTGTEGNKIYAEKIRTQDGYSLTLYFGNQIIGNYFNYSYDTSLPTYLGTLIANDPVVSNIVEFTADVIPGSTFIYELPYGVIELSGGDSGTHEGTVGISDAKYIEALEMYKNVDLYNIDTLAVSGNVSEAVHDKIQEVCEQRMDCFGIIDPPEDVAGIDGNIYSMINWHNGLLPSLRTKKLDSMYLATYYPWILLNVSYNTTNPRQWHAPTVRAVGMISQNDKLSGHKFAAPAGPRSEMTSIEALAAYLREDDKARLYADELGNSINPIVYTTTRGFFVDGQKNSRRDFDALSRLNVLRTALYIKKKVYSIAPDFFWQPLTNATREEMKSVLTTMMNELVERKAIKEGFTVTCDSSNNSEAVEAKRGIIASIEWEPVGSIEKIKIISTIKDKRVVTTTIG